MTTDLESMIFATTARVARRAMDTTALTNIITDRGADASIFDTNPPFFWPNEISSNRLDAYFTTMDPLTTLPNFAADAARGVAFLAGHNNCELPFGSTLTGTLENTGDVTRVLADAYTLSGLELGGVNADSFIAGVRGGIIRDVSVGFYGGQWICAICGRDMLADWYDCWHVPGLVYEIKDADAGLGQTVVRELLCSATIKNAHLAEVSAVYDGATPGAAILQAQRAAESGHLSHIQARLLEQRYRINLPGKRVQASGVDIPKETEPVKVEDTPLVTVAEPITPPVDETIVTDPASTEPATTETPAVDGAPAITETRSVAVQTPGTATNTDAFALLRSALGLETQVDVIAHVRQLEQAAADGSAYRKTLVDAALREGTRALGDTFREDDYRKMLNDAPIAFVERMRDDWTAIGNQRFIGGRKTNDETPVPPAPAAPAAVKVPDAAFSG